MQLSQPLSDFIAVSPGPALCAIECALTLGVAVLSWHLIERPILRLKDRIPYRREHTHAPRSSGSTRGPISEPIALNAYSVMNRPVGEPGQGISRIRPTISVRIRLGSRNNLENSVIAAIGNVDNSA